MIGLSITAFVFATNLNNFNDLFSFSFVYFKNPWSLNLKVVVIINGYFSIFRPNFKKLAGTRDSKFKESVIIICIREDVWS